MSISIIMFILLTTFNAVVQLSFEPFYGDSSLESYLQTFICLKFHGSKWSFIYLHQLTLPNDKNLRKTMMRNSINSNLNSTFLKRYFHCFTAVYRELTEAQLRDSLTAESRLKHTQILTIIRLPSISPSSSSSTIILAKYLTYLNSIYTDCNRCLPFLLLLPPNAQLNTLKLALSSAHLNFTFPLRSVITFAPFKNLTLHLNPILDGCAQEKRGLFYPSNEHDFSRLKSTKCNLNNSQLTASVNVHFSYCSLVFEKQNSSSSSSSKVSFGTDFTGESNLLRVLQQKYHFRFSLLHAEQKFGINFNQTKGVWEGVTGHVFSRAADLGLCGLSVTYERNQVIDFTTYTQWNTLDFITRYPHLKPRHWLAVEPFSTSIWALVGASFATLLIAILLLSKLNSHPNYYLIESATLICSILLQNCMIKIKSF